MPNCILINNPPNFCAGLAHCPPDLLEVKNLYCNVNIGIKNSKGFIQSSTSAIWPFRKTIRKAKTKPKDKNLKNSYIELL